MATKTPTPADPATRTRRAPQPLPPVSPEAREMISWGAHLLFQALARPEQGTTPLATSVYWALAGISLAMTEDPALERGLRRLRRGDKGTVDLILALGHAVPGTLRDWVGGDERHRASGATPPASAGGPAIVPTAACPTSDADEVEARELFLEMRRAAARPDSVKGLQAYANSQQGAAEYERCHWLAAYVGALAAGTSPPARATYQAPPRRPAQGAAAPMIASADTKKEITQ